MIFCRLVKNVCYSLYFPTWRAKFIVKYEKDLHCLYEQVSHAEWFVVCHLDPLPLSPLYHCVVTDAFVNITQQTALFIFTTCWSEMNWNLTPSKLHTIVLPRN